MESLETLESGSLIIINITTDICLKYAVINKEPTKIYNRKAEKMITLVRKNKFIKERNSHYIWPVKTEEVFFCGKFSMMRQYLKVFIFSRTVESHI